MIHRVGNRSAALAAALLVASFAWSQPYPAKPVKILVPFPPGGTTDAAARIIGEKLGDEWKQPVVVESRLGAGTTIAAAFVANSPPDGYLLYLTSVITQASTGALYTNLSYDALRSFAPVGPVTTAPFVLVAPAVRAEGLQELIQLARSKPGQLTYASSGSGGAPHLVTELFAKATGITWVHVPFKGMAPAVTSLLAGQADFLVGDVSVMPQVRSGKLKALAVTTARRSALVPGVPTLGEAGVPALEIVAVQGMLAPSRTPREVLGRVNASLNRALAAEDVRKRLNAQGMEPAPAATPEEFGAFVAAEFQKYGRIIQDARIRLD
jgi:tripartite-type tricarboxylate transporter receptor subunit TctC